MPFYRRRRIYRRRKPMRRYGRYRSYRSRRGAQVSALMRSGVARTLSGHGDYYVKKNSLILSQDPPSFKTFQKGGFVEITHREYLGNIVSAGTTGAYGTAFNVQSFIIQPGNVTTFPWFSQVAVNYQEYSIEGMLFEFKSLSSDAIATSNTSAALGSVIMATNYNVLAPAYTSKLEMLESEFSSECKPSCSMMHPIECARRQSPLSNLYVRGGPISGADYNFYDFALFQIATEGLQATSALCGDLWSTFAIRLYKPILGGNVSGIDLPADKYQLSGVTGTSPLGSTHTLVSGSNLNTSISGNVLSFPNDIQTGNYLVDMHWVGVTGAGIIYPTLTLSANTSNLQTWCNNAGFDTTSVATSPQASVNSLVANQQYIVNITDSSTLPVTVTYGSGGTLPSQCIADLIITQVPNWAT